MKKKIFGILLSMFFILSSLANATSLSITSEWDYEVDDNADESWYEDETHFDNIQEAIDAAKDNDIIFVYSGRYKGNITIDKSITLQGEENKYPIIDGRQETNCINIIVDSVTVSGFKIINALDQAGFDEAGIYITSSYNKIYDNKIFNNYYDGISLKDSSSTEIYNNEFKSNIIGIVTNRCDNLHIYGNKFSKIYEWIGAYHINLGESTDCIVELNDITEAESGGNGIGIRIDDCTRLTVTNNNFKDNDRDEVVYFHRSMFPKLWEPVNPFTSGIVFDNNYWGRSKIKQKITVIMVFWIAFYPMINFQLRGLLIDENPAERPFDI